MKATTKGQTTQIYQQKVEQLNKNVNTVLPPALEGNTYGYLFLDIGNLNWMIYNGENYLESEVGDSNKGIHDLFANIRFWGDNTKGVYIKFANGLKKKETAINNFKYDIKCPEKTFEKYLDDMGTLIVDFYDVKKNQTIGTTKIFLKLYIKREKKPTDDSPLLELRGTFPISLTSNPNIKIGEFSMSLVSSFTDPFATKGIKQREIVSLEDSFIEHEKMAQEMSKVDKDKRLIEKAFSDDRIPSSLQGKRSDSAYKQTDFDFEIHEKPTRDRPSKSQTKSFVNKENQRNIINIDEGEDTFHNQEQFEKIFNRGERLRQQMNEALTKDNAWESLHGQFEVPKNYVPPFLQKKDEPKSIKDDELYEIYALEVDEQSMPETQRKKEKITLEEKHLPQVQTQQEDTSNGQIRDMKYIKLKIKTLRIENEELLHKLIDETFNLYLDIPLPDIYQKKITYQHLKLSNYDIVSFNEFVYNSLTLYNFKIDEETFNQLVNAQLKIGIEGQDVSGSFMMNKLLLAKNFKMEVKVPLEKRYVNQDQENKVTQKTTVKKGTTQKQIQPQKQATKAKIQDPVVQTKLVGHITLEINLQRGDNEEELQRNYQIQVMKMQEQKNKEEEERKMETMKKMKFNMNQEPIFGQLYLHIDSARNLVMKKQTNNDTFNVRADNQSEAGEEQHVPLIAEKKNLFVQYKAFPTLEKLKTNTVFSESEPKFNYRSQFPILMNPDNLEKLEKFTFVLEVWDAVTPGREEFVGLVKIPLASFFYSMKTTDDQIFSLNFLADQHCLYPMIIADQYLPIYSIKQGANVGELKVTLALGSPIQINRQIQKEQEQEKQLQQSYLQQQLAEQLRLQMQKQEQEEQKRKEERELELERQRQQQELERQKQLEESKILSPQPQKSSLVDFLQQEGKASPMMNFFRQSLNLSGTGKDWDMRKMTYLHCLRKLFEEARACGIQEINSDEIFKDSLRNFDGSVKKDDFIFSLMNKQEFSMTRTEVTNICTLLLNINRNDNNNIDIDELQFSYKQYLKYFEIIESRIRDLLERIKLPILKKIESQDQIESFISSFEERAIESKIPIIDLREYMENSGINLGESLYNQFSSYFDLDRNGVVYISSFCEYMRNPSLNNFNFFKVNPAIQTNILGEFIKNSLDTDNMKQLEEEFKQEVHKAAGKTENEEISSNLLVTERINAKLFQFKLKKQGVVLSLWEVFTLFEHLNTIYAKMFYEPQRYHFITYGLFYKYITGMDYETKIQEEEHKKQQELEMKQVKASTDSVFDLAQNLNKDKKQGASESEGGLYSHKSELDQQSDEEVIIKKGSPHRRNKSQQRELTFADKEDELEDTHQFLKKKDQFDFKEEDKPYKQIKHIFEIKVKELKNIPILDRLIKDISSTEAANQSVIMTGQTRKEQTLARDSNKYIQNAAVKYSFPLDEDEIVESDYLQLNKKSLEEKNSIDFKVSMDTTHTFILSKIDLIKSLLEHQQQSDLIFNISLVLYDEGKEYIVGNAHLAITDLEDLVDCYETKSGLYDDLRETATLKRNYFIYGTTYSQRENCIIGSIDLEITYGTQKLYLSPTQMKEAVNDQESCFMHRETYINRKIPLNAVLSVSIDKIQNLKESIQNIEHFAKIQQNALNEVSKTPKSNISQSMKTNSALQTKDQVERRRILTTIFKQGLNLCVMYKLFEESQELKEKFPNSQNHTRLLYNTLNPIYNENFELNLQMEEKIFEYLKNKKAIFEVRHYILPQQTKDTKHLSSALFNQEQLESHRTDMTEEEERDILQSNDYIVIGYVRVPLLSLITKNNGIDGDFSILDDYKQQMGTLRLKIALNHHTNKRSLYSTTNKLPIQAASKTQTVDLQRQTLIDRTVAFQSSLARGKPIIDSQYFLGINFVELILKDRQNILQAFDTGISQCFLYLKFRFLGQNYQTKFISKTQPSDTLKKMDLRILDIKKTTFIELDFSRQQDIEEAFSKPLECQLWFKKEHMNKYQQPEQEVLLGSFFIELNELSKITNKRIKDQNGQIQSYEGYFTLYDYDKEQVACDRLGAKLYLIHKDYDAQLSDLEVLFHNLQKIEQAIQTKLDPNCKGHADLDDLKTVINKDLNDPYKTLILDYVDKLEYKNQDKVYYSSLFGLPAPFFRYANRIDQFGVVDKINRELQALDTHENGFVPLALFRSVIEHELKIKEKIVVDFIQNMKDYDGKTLDVNVVSHSFKNHIDYIVLLRKLCLYYDITSKSDISEVSKQHTQRALDNEVSLKIEIESALRLRNPLNQLEPPNAFVQMRSPFYMSQPEQVVTNIIQQSSYPAWHHTLQQLTFPITEENLKILLDTPLEFEVYHQQLGSRDAVTNYLIGVAFVDLSQMVHVNGINQVTGPFHIVKKDLYRSSLNLTAQDPKQLMKDSLGQIKINIQSNVNLRNLLYKVPQSETIIRENSPLKERSQTNPFAMNTQTFNVSFAKDTFQQQQELHHLMSDTHKRLESSLKQFGIQLSGHQEEELKFKHSQNMQQLEELTKKLQGSLKGKSINEPEKGDHYIRDFTMTRGYNQSQQLREELKPFSAIIRNPIETKYGAHPNDVVQEEQSDFDREENVFAQNISESSEQNQPSQHNETINNEDEEDIKTPKQQLTYDKEIKEESKQEQEHPTNIKDPLMQSTENIFEQQSLKPLQQQSETKKRVFDMDDEEIDFKEMERLEKIFKSQKK